MGNMHRATAPKPDEQNAIWKYLHLKPPHFTQPVGLEPSARRPTILGWDDHCHPYSGGVVLECTEGICALSGVKKRKNFILFVLRVFITCHRYFRAGDRISSETGRQGVRIEASRKREQRGARSPGR